MFLEHSETFETSRHFSTYPPFFWGKNPKNNASNFNNIQYHSIQIQTINNHNTNRPCRPLLRASIWRYELITHRSTAQRIIVPLLERFRSSSTARRIIVPPLERFYSLLGTSSTDHDASATFPLHNDILAVVLVT